jgi:hypothetical protein
MITIPTTIELEEQILAKLEAEFGVPINPEGKAELRAQAATEAATLKGLYLSIADTQKNIYPDTCDEPTLRRVGAIKLGREPFESIAGQYGTLVTGTIGAVIKSGTVWVADDTSLNPGALYRLDEAYTMVSTSDTITLRALTSGDGGQLDIGDTLTSTEPISLVASGATVTVEVIQPLAAEDIEVYREKVIQAFRIDAQGGAPGDYRIWASDAQGVRRVYPYAWSGVPNGVIVYVEATVADSPDGKGTPSAQILSDVEDVIELDPDTSLDINKRGRRPTQVNLNVTAITPRTLAITIPGYQGLTAQIQTDLLSAFTEAVSEIRPFIAGAEPVASQNDSININKINGVIYTTKPGAVYGTPTFTIDGVPLTTFTFTAGNIPWLSVITYP